MSNKNEVSEVWLVKKKINLFENMQWKILSGTVCL